MKVDCAGLSAGVQPPVVRESVTPLLRALSQLMNCHDSAESISYSPRELHSVLATGQT